MCSGGSCRWQLMAGRRRCSRRQGSSLWYCKQDSPCQPSRLHGTSARWLLPAAALARQVIYLFLRVWFCLCVQVPVAAAQGTYKKDDFFDQLSCDTLERTAQNVAAASGEGMSTVDRAPTAFRDAVAALCRQLWRCLPYRSAGLPLPSLPCRSCVRAWVHAGEREDWRTKMQAQRKVDMETFGGMARAGASAGGAVVMRQRGCVICMCRCWGQRRRQAHATAAGDCTLRWASALLQRSSAWKLLLWPSTLSVVLLHACQHRKLPWPALPRHESPRWITLPHSMPAPDCPFTLGCSRELPGSWQGPRPGLLRQRWWPGELAGWRGGARLLVVCVGPELCLHHPGLLLNPLCGSRSATELHVLQLFQAAVAAAAACPWA